ncbi:adenylosuccinate lyase [Acetivibrio straminisolvens JCM 21531]|uniref:Adenylosuccinate lyase n=2 Tax=Acetivibrio straminisolvens TaxID=253314 RepID=W4VA65_9FIRM|nr:adenylosuccinate lyase [Acetivibrio straminisolvens JCM 21531]
MEAAKQVKAEGKKNDLIERIAADEMFGLSIDELKSVLAPENYIGRSPQQVEEFINEYVKPVLEKNKIEDIEVELKV